MLRSVEKSIKVTNEIKTAYFTKQKMLQYI